MSPTSSAVSATDAPPNRCRAPHSGLLDPLWTAIGQRAPLFAPLVAVTLVGFGSSLAMRSALAQALASRGQAVVANAIFLVWLAAVLSPAFALGKAAALTATGWALATLGGRDVRVRPLLSLLLFGQVVILARDVFVAAVLYWRGLDAIAAPSDLLVPTGLDLLLPNLGPVARAITQATGVFDLLWVAFVVLGLERVLSLRRREAFLGAGALWTVRVAFSILRGMLLR
jgi:hypothetical protein